MKRTSDKSGKYIVGKTMYFLSTYLPQSSNHWCVFCAAMLKKKTLINLPVLLYEYSGTSIYKFFAIWAFAHLIFFFVSGVAIKKFDNI